MSINPKFVDLLNRRRVDYVEELHAFNDKFMENPLYALTSNGDRVFQAAARLNAVDAVLETIKNENITIVTLSNILLDRIKYMTKYPSMSTSASSNVAHLYETAAYTEILEKLELYEETI